MIAAAGRAQLPIAVVAAGGFLAGLVHLMIYPCADQVEEAHKCNTRQADAYTLQAFTYTIQTLQSNKHTFCKKNNRLNNLICRKEIH